MKALIAASGLFLSAQTVPPAEYQSLEPLTATVTFADAEWVNAECIKRVGRKPDPGMVFEACAGVGRSWMILRHGALYPDERCGFVVNHETSHVRGWWHG